MEVDYKDRDEHINYMSIALRSVGFNIDYEAAELIKFTIDKVDKLGGKFTIMDAAKLQSSHEEYWKKYHERKDPKNE